MNTNCIAYAMAGAVVFIWGITFVSTKVLLDDLSPAAVMFYRHLPAYAVLWLVRPRLYLPRSLREELLFACAGLCGGTLYFLAENYALQYSMASNVALLLAASPMITALAAHLATREKVTRNLIAGFVIAFVGTFCVVCNGQFVLRLNPLGDVLTLAACLVWAVYSVMMKRIDPGIDLILCTRRMFFYTILTMLPVLPLTGFVWEWDVLCKPVVAGNLLFLGVLASAICFLAWNRAIRLIGPVRTNNFIYLIPLVTMLVSAVVLDEPITPLAVCGGVLIVAGVYVALGGRRTPGLRAGRTPAPERGVRPEHP